MKNIVSIILILGTTSLFGCSGKTDKMEKKTDWQYLKLNGEVKSLQETSYLATEKSGEVVKEGRGGKDLHNTHMLFNKVGFRLEETKYEHNDTIFLQQAYTFNNENQIVAVVHFFGYSGDTERHVFEYNENGQLSKIDVYNEDNHLEGTHTYSYDNNDRIAEQRITHFNNYMNRKIGYAYDDNDNMTEFAVYGYNSELNNKRIYKYDNRRNIIELHCIDTNVNKRYTYMYNDNNLVIEEHVYNADNVLESVWTYKYEFDLNDNWIVRYEYQDNMLKHLTERKIEYFD